MLRLADMMINPDLVFWDGSIISDRYVLLDMAATPRVQPNGLSAPGSYQLLKTKPAIRSGNQVPQSMGSIVPSDAAKWTPIKWSSWSNGVARVGALHGDPVFVNSEWLDRLPDDWRIEGAPGERAFRIAHFGTMAYQRGQNEEWTRTIGCVCPIRVENIGPVERAIAAELS